MSTELMGSIKLCRLCANIAEDTGSNNVFDKCNENVMQQIKELTGLILRDMPKQMLPRYVCKKCKKELPRACDFRRKIIETQSYFKSQDYKSKFKADEEDFKPTFTFVPLNEFGMNETLQTNTISDKTDEARDDSLTAAEYAGTVIKEETNNLNERSINQKDTNKINVSRTRKLKIIPKLTDNPPKNSFEILNASCTALKIEHDEFSGNEHNENMSEDQFNSMESCIDANVSEEFCSESSANHEDSEDPEFVVKSKNAKIKKQNDTINKTENVILKDRQLNCYLCQHPLENLIGLKIHFRKQHKGEKFKCDLCEEKFSTIKSFEHHLRLHQGVKRFKCRNCDLSFNYHSTRVRHERRWHLKDSPFLCTICGKSFITAYMGREHMTVHTKERAFHCTVCNAKFLRKTHLKTHYRSVTHKNNEKKINETLSVKNNNVCQRITSDT